MSETKHNLADIEKDIATIEDEAIAEEQSSANQIFAQYKEQIDKTEAELLYPEINRYDTAPQDERDALQYMKKSNSATWEKKDRLSKFYFNPKLYIGHLSDKDVFITDDQRLYDDPELAKLRFFTINSRLVELIFADDARHSNDVQRWRYPDKHSNVQFSRNVLLDHQEVKDVDIVFDKNQESFRDVTDAYLRKALIRNKDKAGAQSIIATIQQKQYEIRNLPARESFIVQGCAGSGKTMVLLHRLRYLLYNNHVGNKEYIFLVPGNKFKSFISEISTNFGIAPNRILTYQVYYQNILGKKPKIPSLNDSGELAFGSKYLERVYSKEFIQQCHGVLFERIAKQTNKLITFFKNKLNYALKREQALIQTDIDSIRQNAVDTAQTIIDELNCRFPTKIATYNDVVNLTVELEKKCFWGKDGRNFATNSDVAQQSPYEGVSPSDANVILVALKNLISDVVAKTDKLQSLLTNDDALLKEKLSAQVFHLNNAIDSSSSFADKAPLFVEKLTPSYNFIDEIVDCGTDLINAFSSYLTPEENKLIEDKFKLFTPKTQNQLHDQLNRLLLNICKKTIKEEFGITICDEYKHFWYLNLYCTFLTKPLRGAACKYLFVDEAQDLSVQEIELIAKIIGLNNKPVMNLFGDTQQTISDNGISDWCEVSFIDKVHTLDENFRNTNQIVDFCNNELSMNMVKIGIDMEDVSQFDDFQQAMTTAPTIHNNPIFIVKDEYSELDLKSTLLAANFSANYEIYTAKSAKGLEFKEVFVFDSGMTSNERYVAYTRALTKLNVIKNLPQTVSRDNLLVTQGNEDDETDAETME